MHSEATRVDRVSARRLPMDNGHSSAAVVPGVGPSRQRGTDPNPSVEPNLLGPADTFVRRHIGPDEAEVREMLEFLGFESLEQLSDATVPESIRLRRPL